MKIYLTPPQPSLGLERIRTALTRYKPEWVEVVDSADHADLVVLYAIGRHDALMRQAQNILQEGRQYAVIQVSLRSTMTPSTRNWEWLWADAECVWSYYDLEQAVRDDYEGYNPGSDFQVSQFCKHVNFYHAPLGVDAEVFVPYSGLNRENLYVIATSGLSRLSESVRECWLAAEAVNRDVLHVGRQFDRHNIVCAAGIGDDQLAEEYSACEFVSGLRRKEGFELPAVEGLLCGARPIVFDTPDYHWNYGDHAEYIYEGTRQEVVDQLVELFKRGARPVTSEERAAAVERFNWETIIKGFYERLH